MSSIILWILFFELQRLFQKKGVVVQHQSSTKHHIATHSLPPSEMEERISRIKVRRVVG